MAIALGFRVKSGWAAAVLLDSAEGSPRVIDCRAVELSDPEVPHSRQPYHAAFGTAQTDRRTIDRLVRSVESRTRNSIANLLEECHRSGHPVSGAALVVGSDIDPARIANQHIRAHALEGRLFRTALESALRSQKVSCRVVVERDLNGTAIKELRMSDEKLKSSVVELGRGFRGRWRSDEKAAALAAWLVLHAGSRKR